MLDSDLNALLLRLRANDARARSSKKRWVSTPWSGVGIGSDTGVVGGSREQPVPRGNGYSEKLASFKPMTIFGR